MARQTDTQIFKATDKAADTLPPQAAEIVKAAGLEGATRETIVEKIKAVCAKQKPARVFSYYKTRLLAEGYITELK